MKRLILISILIVLVFQWGCKKNESIQPLTKTQKAAFNYLPGESQFIMFVNLDELRKTNFWDNYFKSALFENYSYKKWFPKFEEKTGIGINGGISQVFISSDKRLNKAAVVVFNKNLKEIKDYFDTSDNYGKISINNYTVYTFNKKPGIGLYFTDDSTILFTGNIGYLKSVIAGRYNPLIKNKSFISIIKSIKNKNHYWIATDIGTYAVTYMKKIIGMDKNVKINNILKTVESVTLSARFDEGIDIESNWNCKDLKDAYLLSTAINGALAMDLLSGRDHSLGKILQKTEVERFNKQINFQLELKGDDINKLKDFAKQKDLERKL